jgi:UDP-galactose transporter B1
MSGLENNIGNTMQQQMQVITAGGAGGGGSAKPRRSPKAVTAQSEHSVLDDEPRNLLEFEEDTEAAADAEEEDRWHAERSKAEKHQQQQQRLPLLARDDPLLLATAASHSSTATTRKNAELFWLLVCFLGIMFSFVAYGLLLEYTTSGGRKLHELSFLFVTSGLYTLTAAAGRYVRDETPTTIPPARFAILGLTSMGSTFCSVRSLRYVIYPIQVLAKSCKPVPVMLMGTLMGKRYPCRKYINVCLIVLGVAMFMGAGDKKKPEAAATANAAVASDSDSSSSSSASQAFGILLLFVSLCFDGGTGAYEDKLMSVHSVQPFDLMYNIQLGKTILAGIGLLVFNQVHVFLQMIQDMGFLLVALGLTGALGQVFIFVTIAKFGALTCSIIGLARKITTLIASIYFYGHSLNSTQFLGLVISVGSMVMNFMGKSGGNNKKKHAGAVIAGSEEMAKMLDEHDDDDEEDDEKGNRSSHDFANGKHLEMMTRNKYRDNSSAHGNTNKLTV